VNDSLYPSNDTYLAVGQGSLKSDVSQGWLVLPLHLREIAYQVSINLVLLVLFSFNLDETEYLTARTLFAPYKLAFFGNYLVAATIINYVLLPRLYYTKRTTLFIASVLVLVTLVIMIDEWILEQIFFPDTRGTYFPGLLFTLVETLPIIIIMVAFKLAWDFNKKQREVDTLKSLMRESEIEFLKSQINPHFLFNNLNNLYAYAIDNSPKTPSIILDLSTVLRYMLYDCKEDVVSLSKEIQHLKNYTALHQIQIEKRGAINFTEEISNYNFAIPPLILVVFVENAFKHSTGSQFSDIKIDIHVHVSEEGVLTFICTNNYSASYSPMGRAQGIGLKNVRKRLDLLYPKLYSLAILNDGDIFKINMTMQLKNKTA
jgi:sensor histidine kinase YesM